MKKVSAFFTSWPGAIILALVGLSSAVITFIYGSESMTMRGVTAGCFIVAVMALVLMMFKTIDYCDRKKREAEEKKQLEQSRADVIKLLNHIAFQSSLEEARGKARKIGLKLRSNESIEIPRDVIELSSPHSLGAAIGACLYQEIRGRDETDRCAKEIVEILHRVVGDVVSYFQEFQIGITSRHLDHPLRDKIMSALEIRQKEVRSRLTKEQDAREAQETYAKGLKALRLQ